MRSKSITELTNRIRHMHYTRIKQAIFLTLFLLIATFILFIKSELYESNASVIVKNLDNQKSDFGLSLFVSGTSNTMQDSKIVETYLNSYDELQKLDKIFHLKEHYSSDRIDIADRLYKWSTKEDFLALYRSRLQIFYDEISGILNIGFLHTNPQTAKAIVEQLIQDANQKINLYNRDISQRQLSFITKQVETNKAKLEASIQALEKFQSTHTLLDPTQDAQTQYSIVANLETNLVKKRAKLNELRNYMNEKNFEIIRLKHEIEEIEKTLKRIKHSLTDPKAQALNSYIFEYERLKNLVEFNKELYKQSLLQLETIKAELHKNAKMLLVLTKPYLSEGYSYPQKGKALLTITLILGLLYGIISLIEAIIKEHLD